VLTPLIFVPYLLATRRVRAGIVAAVTFRVTIAAGFLVAVGDPPGGWSSGAPGRQPRAFGKI